MQLQTCSTFLSVTFPFTDEEMLYESLSGKGSLLAKGEKAEFKWFRDGVEFDPHERFNVMFKVKSFSQLFTLPLKFRLLQLLSPVLLFNILLFIEWCNMRKY